MAIKRLTLLCINGPPPHHPIQAVHLPTLGQQALTQVIQAVVVGQLLFLLILQLRGFSCGQQLSQPWWRLEQLLQQSVGQVALLYLL